MGKLLRYNIIFEEGESQGEQQGELYEATRKRLEKKLMINYGMGNISFKPLGLKRLNTDEKEFENEDERIEYINDIEEKGYMVIGKDGKQFPKK